MINAIEKDLSNSLKALYNENEVAQRFFDKAAERQRNPASTSVERAAIATESTKSNITDLFKSLEEIGVGTFRLGRRGHKSRIIWDYEIISLGETARGVSEPIEIEDSTQIEDEEDIIFGNDKNENEEDRGVIPHQFQLRSDQAINFSLPKDLTNREAERLANFIKSLPFE